VPHEPAPSTATLITGHPDSAARPQASFNDNGVLGMARRHELLTPNPVADRNQKEPWNRFTRRGSQQHVSGQINERL